MTGRQNRSIPPAVPFIRRPDRLMRGEEGLNVIPLEPIVTGAMASLARWVAEGPEAPPSRYFSHRTLPYGPSSGTNSGVAQGGIQLGLVRHPLLQIPQLRMTQCGARCGFFPPPRYSRATPCSDEYYRACKRVDQELLRAGYLEPVGFGLLYEVKKGVVDARHPQRPSP